ncbi:hypothetical protein HHI36_019686 [Cryptolaemus montrouzieri]|uniref:Uncharacterized protein n=1 Tax=Cryptolaemus montrouzieri TaxID=559131 RepID=A0ABD2N7Z8_9CUCU
MDRALRVIDLNPLPIKNESMKRKRAEEEEEFEIDFSRNDECFTKGKIKLLNLEIQKENLQTAKENLIEEVKTSKMKMNACQDELKEEKSIMKELDTNIDSCIQREKNV